MIAPDDLAALRLCAGFTAAQAAQLCGVSLRTWRRYEHDAAPAWALVMFQALRGDLGAISTAWDGWTLQRRTGNLFDANGDEYEPGYLRSFWFRNQQAQAYRAEIRALRRKIEKLKDAAPTGAANDAVFSNAKNQPDRRVKTGQNQTRRTPRHRTD